MSLELKDVCQATILNVGCTLNRFRWIPKNIELINGYSTPVTLDNEINKNFKGVMLAPYANRVNHAQYFHNKLHTLNKVWPDEDFAIHGFVYNKLFEIGESNLTDEYVSQTFIYSYQGDESGYPYPFNLSVTYCLHIDGRLTCKTAITNMYNETIPFILGWHPLFFNVDAINRLKLNFDSVYKIELDDNLLPIGSSSYNKYKQAKFIEDDFDYCFLLNSNVITITDEYNGIELNIILENGSPSFKYIQIYTPPNKKSIAIEPMTSWPDAFNNKNDLLIIEPQQTVALAYSINCKTL
ncbi:MAG TPA: aldose 1-epimerase [Bacteroidia bacterium]|nr:aldose 1-epimerase [Bacteroidia bacterium]